MNPAYVDAIDTRLRWIEWFRSGQARKSWDADQVLVGAPYERYRDNLEQGDLFVMEKEFCRLVEHARRQVPDTLTFESAWLIKPRGWLYLAEPFETPIIGSYRNLPPDFMEGVPTGKIRALGWYPIPAGITLRYQDGTSSVAKAGTIGVVIYHPLGPVDFTPFSYFSLEEGDQLGDRLDRYESQARAMTPIYQTPDGITYTGAYDDPEGMWKHEIRWAFTALHLMSQKLAVTVRRPLDRAARRRAERVIQPAPQWIEAVTLRRLEAARTRDPKGQDVDWAWSWTVEGHYRKQWYPSEHVHKEIFIEMYVKGPPDRPLKPRGLKLYVAKR